MDLTTLEAIEARATDLQISGRSRGAVDDLLTFVIDDAPLLIAAVRGHIEAEPASAKVLKTLRSKGRESEQALGVQNERTSELEKALEEATTAVEEATAEVAEAKAEVAHATAEAAEIRARMTQAWTPTPPTEPGRVPQVSDALSFGAGKVTSEPDPQPDPQR